jgi:GNAT superfamily N-acetyltransferase
MEKEIEIKRLKREQLKTAEYAQFIQSLFVAEKVAERLNYAKWVFLDNPALKPHEDLPIYLCKVNGENAGQLAIIPVESVLACERIRGGWCIDFFVNSKYQRRGIGQKLVNAAFADFPLLMTLGQTDASFTLFNLGLDWIFNENRLINYKTILKQRLVFKFAIYKLGLFALNAAKIVNVSKFDLPSNVSFEMVSSFADYHGVLRGQDINNKKVAGILRTEEFLEWRYLKHPYIKYKISKITVSCEKIIHIVWRILKKDGWSIAIIVDVLYTKQVQEASMTKALDTFQYCIGKMGLEMIDCSTTDHLVLEGFGNKKMSRKEPQQRFLYGMNSMATCPVIDNEQWLLYAGDCDVEALIF